MTYAEMTVADKERFLLMESYMTKDLRVLSGYKSKTTLSRLLAKCRELGGAIPNRPYAITSESYWRYLGSSREKELRYVLMCKEKEND